MKEIRKIIKNHSISLGMRIKFLDPTFFRVMGHVYTADQRFRRDIRKIIHPADPLNKKLRCG
jgi:hypothetical protein